MSFPVFCSCGGAGGVHSPECPLAARGPYRTPGRRAPQAPAPRKPWRRVRIGGGFPWPAILCLLAGFVWLAAPGCVAPNEACSPRALGAIEEQYIAEAFTACKGYAGEKDWRAACGDTYKQIAEKYQKQRDAWVRCQ